MPKIITITFNPSIDKSTSVFSLIPEIKLKCDLPLYEPGGGGINVARAINKLGGDAIAVYLAGGHTGDKFIELLKTVAVKSIQTKTRNNTRENLVVLEESTNKQFRFGMPGMEVYESEWSECLRSIDNIDGIDYIIASGSLPAGIPTDIFVRIGLIAKKKKARYIVDTAGEALKLAVEAGVYLIKPNLEELGSLTTTKNLDIQSIRPYAYQIIDKRQCEVIVVSLGAAGAWLFSKDQSARIEPPKVIRKSTVGAGDSMVAGIVHYLSLDKNLLEAIKYGVACGTAATMNKGSELCRKKDADWLHSMLAVHKEIL